MIAPIDSVTQSLLKLFDGLLKARLESHIIVDTLLMKAELLLPGLAQDDYVIIVRAIIDAFDTKQYFQTIDYTDMHQWGGSERARQTIFPEVAQVIAFPKR